MTSHVLMEEFRYYLAAQMHMTEQLENHYR